MESSQFPERALFYRGGGIHRRALGGTLRRILRDALRLKTSSENLHIFHLVLAFPHNKNELSLLNFFPMIIPNFKCRDMDESIAFYTKALDFELVGRWPPEGFPSFSELNRNDDILYLSTHSGDGAFGSVITIPIDNCDALFKKFLSRGLDTSPKKESPVHQGPVDQTWGNREFYVTDPSGNTLRFVELGEE